MAKSKGNASSPTANPASGTKTTTGTVSTAKGGKGQSASKPTPVTQAGNITTKGASAGSTVSTSKNSGVEGCKKKQATSLIRLKKQINLDSK